MTDTQEIKERLCEENGKGKHALGYHHLINPDGPDAISTIEALEAENAKLRAFQKEAVKQVCDLSREAGSLRDRWYCRRLAAQMRGTRG